MNHFDPDLLRTLVAFAEAGSLAHAAASVGRTPSAVTAQMQRLEESVGVPLIEPAGRGCALTDAGERLVGHARRILAANNEAWLSITGAAADGRVAVGMTQDFADKAPQHLRLPKLPKAEFSIRVRQGSDEATLRLANVFAEGLKAE
jgi:DNA-binding transcriptional LysR family regulator